jgi:ankyrin repeat protein
MDIGSKIHELIKAGDNEGLSSLLSHIKSGELNSYVSAEDIVNQKNKKKHSPLHEAIFRRDLAAVTLLVQCYADCNLKCHGTPALHLLITLSQLPDGYDFSNSALSCLLEMESIVLDAKVIFFSRCPVLLLTLFIYIF